MKLMKNAIMILLVAMLISALLCPVAGAVTSDDVENDGFQDVTTQVSLEIDDEFTVTIPTNIQLTKIVPNAFRPDEFTFRTDPSALPEIDVKVTIINATKQINITVSSSSFNEGNWTMTGASTGIKIPYYLKAGDHIEDTDYATSDAKAQHLLLNESSVLITNSTKNIKLHALVAEIPSGSDNFYDSLTFTVKYEDKRP